MGISFVNKLNKAGRDYRYVWPQLATLLSQMPGYKAAFQSHSNGIHERPVNVPALNIESFCVDN